MSQSAKVIHQKPTHLPSKNQCVNRCSHCLSHAEKVFILLFFLVYVMVPQCSYIRAIQPIHLFINMGS